MNATEKDLIRAEERNHAAAALVKYNEVRGECASVSVTDDAIDLIIDLLHLASYTERASGEVMLSTISERYSLEEES